MSRAIINKHVDNISKLTRNTFVSDNTLAKGEIVICNDKSNPSIYILNTDGEVSKVAGDSGGNGGGGTVDSEILTNLQIKVNQLELLLQEIQNNGAKSLIKEDIQVAGLNGTFGSGYYKNGDIITAGTDVTLIIKNILQKESYPSLSSQSASASTSLNALSLLFNETASTVEVGTLIKMTEGKCDGEVLNVIHPQISGMDYGYYTKLNGGTLINNSILSGVCSATSYNGDFVISATINSGFDADKTNNVKTTPETKTGNSTVSLNQTNLGCANEGSNKLTINATGATYSYTANTVGPVYYCSNLGNISSSKTKHVPGSSGITETKTATTYKEVTGKYKYFLGYSDKTSASLFDSSSIRALNAKSDWVVKDGTTTIVNKNTYMESNGKSIVIACPSKYKLATIFYTIEGASMLENFTSTDVIPVKTGEIMTNYNVYVYPIKNGATVKFRDVTLTLNNS